MVKIGVPATSANLGPGFDCLGLALDIYNTYEVTTAKELSFEGVDQRYCNEDNLFVQAYRKAGGQGNFHLSVHSEIPVSRGLGSSASLYAAGALAALASLQKIDYDRLFQITADLEGHPDNAAPAVYGGLTANMKGTNGWISRQLPIHESLCFTALIPDVEISTEEARGILPAAYPRHVAAANAGKAVLMTEALRCGDIALLKEAAKDEIHEPYRRTLIPGFDAVKKTAEEDSGGVLVISGSGSTCLLIADRYLGEAAKSDIFSLTDHWKIMEPKIGRGAELLGK